MPHPSPFTPAERLESVKVAIAGGLTAGLMSLGLLMLHRFTPSVLALPLFSVWSGLAGLTLLLNVAIAALSGSLFALTYRYAIRQDDNFQLQAGVVLAFTLVRGLAQVDAGSAIAQHFWPFFAACGESLLLFGGSAIALNFAFAQTWLKPFGADR
ncbi:MAG: hypothetical protein F6K00_20590 [Leptolyngbya sp. SIOISBB]|nr:hypothetical protein [Leptolyngbya sp. SIOISBB]